MTIQFSLKQPSVPISSASEHLSFINANDAEFRAKWLEFFNQQTMCGFRYYPSVFEFYRMLSAAKAIDLSFIVLSSGVPIALVPLVVERIGGRLQASYCNGAFLPHPIFHPKLGAKQLRSLESLVFKTITEKLSALGCSRWLCEADILSIGSDTVEDQMMARFGGLDISAHCHVVDLTTSDEDLWLQIRQSSKRIINKGLKTYEFIVYDKTNFTFDIGERHRILHHKCAGRVTRPPETFHKMYSWLDEGHGVMFEQKFSNQTVQMVFVVLGKDTAYGASSADDPDFPADVPLMHPMTYFIYKEMQKRGVKYYDVGETNYRDTPFRIRTDKERTIHDFKRGFGKQTFPLKKWIWFADPTDEVSYLEERISEYKRHTQKLVTLGDDELPLSWIDGALEKFA